MKRCCTCHEWKKFEEFHRRASSRDGRQPRCRSCVRDWYQANKQEHKTNVRRRSDAVKLENWELMKRYLQSHPCVDCGANDLRVLDFDHRVGEEKVRDVGNLLKDCYSWKVILREIVKCDVRCSNCHRVVTCERANNWRQRATLETGSMPLKVQSELWAVCESNAQPAD